MIWFVITILAVGVWGYSWYRVGWRDGRVDPTKRERLRHDRPDRNRARIIPVLPPDKNIPPIPDAPSNKIEVRVKK